MASRTYSNRYEIKYLVEARRQAEIEERLLPFLEPDDNNGESHGYYNYSIYFDSPRYNFYSEKREGELVRIKPRIRLYRSHPSEPPASIFLELKGRYDRIVAKRRSPIDQDLAEHLLSPGPIDVNGAAKEGSATAEFLYLANRFNLSPCVTVLYQRSAYFGAFYPDVRVTFDRVIQCSRATGLNNPVESFVDALPASWLVIELKYCDKVPRMLLQRFNSLGLRQATLSKFALSLERTQERALEYQLCTTSLN